MTATTPPPGGWASGRDILFINLASFLSQVIQVGSFPVFVPLVLAELGTSEAVIGYVASLAWVCVLVLARPAAASALRFGYKATALAGLALNAVAVLALLVFEADAAGLVLASVAVGAGLILRWIACDAWIMHACPEDRRGRFIGIHESLMGFGIAAGPLLLLVTGSGGSAYLGAALVVLIAAALLFQLARAPEAAPEQEEGVGPARLGTGRLVALLALTVCGAILSGYVETATITLGPLYFQQAGTEVSLSLVYLTAFGLGGTLLQYPIGHLVDHIGVRRVQILLAAVLAAGALWLAGGSGPVPVALGVLFAWGGAVGGLNTVAVIDAGAVRARGYQIARGVALVASAYTVGSIVGPGLSGWLWHVMTPGAMFQAFALAAACYGAALIIRESRAGSRTSDFEPHLTAGTGGKDRDLS